MKLKLFILLLTSLFSCKMQHNEAKQPTLISATKSLWFGGVKGVEGIKFNMVLESDKAIIFDELVFSENQKLKVTQKENKGKYYLSSSWTAKRKERTLDLDGTKTTQKAQKPGNTAKLYYHYQNSEKTNFILVEFTTEDDPKMFP